MDEFYNKVKKFWNSRSEKNSFLWRKELAPFKLNFIKNNIKKNSVLLDLGAGDLSLDFELADYVSEIVAVDYAPVILNQPHHIKIKPYQKDVYDFISNDLNSYDHIIVIGVMNFIKNSLDFYNCCKNRLKSGGSLIVAHQCSTSEEISISGVVESEKYNAIYPNSQKEKQMLESLGFHVSLVDPYPIEFNYHDNTEFKGFICKT